MSRARILILGTSAVAAAAVVGLLWRDMFAAASSVQAVPRGDQEIAWIDSATAGSNWERLVAAAHHLRAVSKTGQELEIDDRLAFPDRSFEAPQIALRVPGGSGRLWVRWYKVTSRTSAGKWLAALAQRDPAPLAIIGGGNSTDARTLAEGLAKQEGTWRGKAPLLLITNATAEAVSQEGENQKNLMQLYPGRSFRFCFTNSQMAEAVTDFVWNCPDLRPSGNPPAVYRLEWQDDPYSSDLSLHFAEALRAHRPSLMAHIPVRYSVGDYHRPNPQELLAVERLLKDLLTEPDGRPFLIVPAGTQAARRLLQTLTATAPQTRNVVVLTGDSISLTSVYRDRDFAWNIQDVPVPLVFFSHHHPMDWEGLAPNPGLVAKLLLALAPRHAVPWLTIIPTPADFGTTNATDSLLLNVSILDKTMKAAYRPTAGRPQLVADAEILRERLADSRLRDAQSGFFDQDGNRSKRTGEYIVCLRPLVEEGRVLPFATLEVWSTQPGPEQGKRAWRPEGAVLLDYGRNLSEGVRPYADR
jgi:hypothetical protein